MPGKRRPRPLSGLRLAGLLPALLLALLLTLPVPLAGARELRRQLPFVRALLMGDAYVAVADEASALFYNPAALARLGDGSVEALSLQVTTKLDLAQYLLDPRNAPNPYQGIDTSDLAALEGESQYYGSVLRMPILVIPQLGSAFGLALEGHYYLEAVLLQVTPSLEVPALQIEAAFDVTLFWSFYGRFDRLSLGMTGKLTNRAGINKVMDAVTLSGGGTTIDPLNDPDYAAFISGETRLRAGLDLGLVYDLPFAPSWKPRLGLAVLNIGDRVGNGYPGIEFGTRPDPDTPPIFGNIPLNIVAGFAASPTYAGIRYTFALDLVDLGKTALTGDSLNNRTRVGIAMEFGEHEDGTALFSVLTGFNAGHFSVGVLSRINVFEIGFGRYTIEKGDAPGDNPEDRSVLIFAVRV